MFGFLSVMTICQFFLMTLILPYLVHQNENWIKTLVCSLFFIWALFAVIV